MITLRPCSLRQAICVPSQQAFCTFYAGNPQDALASGFGTLNVLNDYWLAPGSSLPVYPHSHPSEVLMYVHEGFLNFENEAGRVGTISVGEFATLSTVNGGRYVHFTVGSPIWAHVYELGFQADPLARNPHYDQRRFSVAERSGGLKLIASFATTTPLVLYAQVRLYSAILERGKHVILELFSNQQAWLHLVQGEAHITGYELRTGDGAGFSNERAFSFTAVTRCEVLLAVTGSGNLGEGGVAAGVFG